MTTEAINKIEAQNRQMLKGGYTMIPNKYFDKIRKKTTAREHLMLQFTHRESAGWNRATASISNSRFVEELGMTEHTIISIRKSLIAKNLLIVVEPPRGRKPGVYEVNLSGLPIPIEPEEIKKDAIDEIKIEEPAEEKQEILPQPENPQEKPAEISEFQNVDNSVDNLKRKRRRVARKSVKRLSRINRTSSINKKKKHTAKNASRKSESAEIEAQARIVCSEFLKIFPNAVPTMALFYYAVKLLGFERALEKLKIIKDYSKHHPVNNPCGLFRSALDRDFEAPLKLRLRFKADDRAQKNFEYDQQKFLEMQAKEQSCYTPESLEAARKSREDFVAMINSLGN